MGSLHALERLVSSVPNSGRLALKGLLNSLLLHPKKIIMDERPSLQVLPREQERRRSEEQYRSLSSGGPQV